MQYGLSKMEKFSLWWEGKKKTKNSSFRVVGRIINEVHLKCHSSRFTIHCNIFETMTTMTRMLENVVILMFIINSFGKILTLSSYQMTSHTECRARRRHIKRHRKIISDVALMWTYDEMDGPPMGKVFAENDIQCWADTLISNVRFLWIFFSFLLGASKRFWYFRYI